MKSAIAGLSVTLLTCASIAQASDLIVLSGGRASCSWLGDPEELSMWPLLEQALPDHELEIVRTCFALDSNSISIDHLAKRGSDGEIFYTVDPYSLPRADALDLLAEYIASQDLSRVTFIGHSYGGWISAQLGLQSFEPAVQIATIDAISPNECGVADFLARNGGCHDFPEDLSALAESSPPVESRLWVNFFQTQFEDLFSGPHHYASENINIAFVDPSGPAFGAHSMMETDARVWERIRSLLEP